MIAMAVALCGTFAFAGEKSAPQAPASAPAPAAKPAVKKAAACDCNGTCAVKTVTVERELTRREKRHLHLTTTETVQVVEAPVVVVRRVLRGGLCR